MSNFKPTTMVKDNFSQRPVGAAVLFLNDFHHGRRLNDLNRCARLVPDKVKSMASILAKTPKLGQPTTKFAIDQLVKWADNAENSEQ